MDIFLKFVIHKNVSIPHDLLIDVSGSTPGKHPTSGRESFEEFGVDKADANISSFKLLCEALASSQIEIICMKDCYLGRQALNLLADAIKFMAENKQGKQA